MLKQRVEILAQKVDELEAGGGSTGDAYTKAESDEKFLSKTDAVSTYATKDYVNSIVGNINTVLEEVL